LESDRSLSFGEELANSVTHGAGFVASLIGLPVLLVGAGERADAPLVVACAVFAVSLIVLYGASTLYHAVPPSRTKRALQVADHVAIYLLIAGTYTPFTIGVLGGPWGWALFGIVWGLASAGITMKFLPRLRRSRAQTLLYLVMGWLVVVAQGPLRERLSEEGLLLLVAGGLLYTAGVGFYAWERQRYSHAVWHLFVLGGSTCHFFAVLWHVLPQAV
jgi:hemolysin III